MVKKGIILVAIFLFISMSVISSTGRLEQSSISFLHNGHILYVGGNGPGNYSRIQDAIDNASDGDTVFVYSDIYFENLLVNKSINLLGEDRNSTIIDGNGSGNIVTIIADRMNISSFTLQNGGLIFPDGGIQIRSNFSVISNNNMENNFYGIVLFNSNNIDIFGNNIKNNNQCGIYLEECNNNNVIGNLTA